MSSFTRIFAKYIKRLIRVPMAELIQAFYQLHYWILPTKRRMIPKTAVIIAILYFSSLDSIFNHKYSAMNNIKIPIQIKRSWNAGDIVNSPFYINIYLYKNSKGKFPYYLVLVKGK